MSDFSAVRQKLTEGSEWRGTIQVSIQGETHELTIRPLTEDEFWEVMGKVDKSEIGSLKEELPAEELEEFRELQGQDEISEDEEERLAELEQLLEDESPDPTDVLSLDTFKGIKLAAKKGVVPSEEDKRRAFAERAREIEEEYGVSVQTVEDVEEPLNREVERMIDRATTRTGFAAFTIGMQVLFESVGEEGN